MSSIVSDLKDKRFGNLLVIEESGRDKWGQVMWLCRCDCGKEKTIAGGNLRRPNGNVSCGCLKASRLKEKFTKQGKSKTLEYRRNKDRLKRFSKYGLTEEDFIALIEKQEHRCAICGVIPDRVSNRLHDGFHIDHCHVSGRVRGLLCGSCNTGIGMLKESEEILLKAITYLRAIPQ
jgi:hypothetical protein